MMPSWRCAFLSRRNVFLTTVLTIPVVVVTLLLVVGLAGCGQDSRRQIVAVADDTISATSPVTTYLPLVQGALSGW